MHVRYFDAFPKHQGFGTTTLGAAGGVGGSQGSQEPPAAIVVRTMMRSITLVAALIMLWLISTSHLGAHEDYNVSVDRSLADQFQVNIEMTVGSPCERLALYVIDRTEDRMFIGEQLRTESTEDVHGQSWCHFGGSFMTNRVQGRLVVSNRIQFLPGQRLAPTNLTHAIRELSFGEYYPGSPDPLDFTSQIIKEGETPVSYGYFINVVPTTYHALGMAVDTFQYSATRTATTLVPQAGPEIFFEWQFDPIALDVYDARMGFFEWLVKCINVLGGLFVLGIWLIRT